MPLKCANAVPCLCVGGARTVPPRSGACTAQAETPKRRNPGHGRCGDPEVENWSRAVGIDFHEVEVDTNAYSLTLVAGLDITADATGPTLFATVRPADEPGWTPQAA
ncbi:YxiG-like protein [Streptomyces spororaveus]